MCSSDLTCQKCGADLNESRKAADEAAAPSPGAPKEISLKPQGLDGAPKAPGAPAAPKAPGAPKPRRTNHAMSGDIQRVF